MTDPRDAVIEAARATLEGFEALRVGPDWSWAPHAGKGRVALLAMWDALAALDEAEAGDGFEAWANDVPAYEPGPHGMAVTEGGAWCPYGNLKAAWHARDAEVAALRDERDGIIRDSQAAGAAHVRARVDTLRERDEAREEVERLSIAFEASARGESLWNYEEPPEAPDILERLKSLAGTRDGARQLRPGAMFGAIKQAAKEVAALRAERDPANCARWTRALAARSAEETA